MRRLRGYLPLILVLILLGAVLLFPSFLFTFIFYPIAGLFWATWRLLLSVNQNVYWLLLIILCGLLMARLFVPARKTVSNPAYDYKPTPPDRVESWRRMIAQAAPGEHTNTALRDRLQELALSMLSLSRHAQPAGLGKSLDSEQASLPPEVRQYLFPAEQSHTPSSKFKWLRARGAGWLRIWKKSKEPQDQASMEAVLQWMENFLEMDHDR